MSLCIVVQMFQVQSWPYKHDAAALEMRQSRSLFCGLFFLHQLHHGYRQLHDIRAKHVLTGHEGSLNVLMREKLVGITSCDLVILT